MRNKVFVQKDRLREILKHETKKNVLIKFLLVLLIFIIYFLFIAAKYGAGNSFFVTVLTWSFFVLCTPIADAGFLFDFPFRLITRIRMFISEIFVWGIAISLNVYAFFTHPEIYSKTKLLLLFQHILEQPFPFWIIILVSAIGTFMSVQFGDELMDKVKYKERVLYEKRRYKSNFLSIIFLIVLSVILYDFLLKKLGINFLIQ